MEQILQYVWKHRLFQTKLTTTDGVSIEVIDVGLQNTDAGPDFFNSKIKIGDKIWVGNIEIHKYSNEWYQHKHNENEAYNSVILHIVEFANKEVYNKDNLSIPQCEISYPKHIKDNIDFLLKTDIPLPCCNSLNIIEPIFVKNWLDSLVTERLERKANDLERISNLYNGSWSHVFYVLLCRYMGFGINSDAFERLAHSIPINSILKHADNLLQIEAILFGQSGFLDDIISSDEFLNTLVKEYEFLKNKFKLSPLDKKIFKLSRTRPSSSIYIRIAQLASLLQNIQGLPRKILDSKDIGQIRLLLHVNTSKYWQTHYNFSESSPKKNKFIGDASLDVLIINVVVPFLFSYGSVNNNEEYIDKALEMLQEIKAEKNSIVRLFSEYGIKINNASDSQAIIQLKREYCEMKKCLYCRIGYRLLSKNNI